MEIQHNAAIPLYEQVANLLRRQIQTDDLKPGAPLPPESELTARFRVSRITARKALGQLAYALISVPYRLGRAFTIDEVSTIPIYTLLEEKAGVEVKRAAQVIRAVAADQQTAKLLGLPKAAPVMMTERVTYAADESPIEHILFFHRGDRYELAVELFRDPGKNVFRPTGSVAELLAGL